MLTARCIPVVNGNQRVQLDARTELEIHRGRSDQPDAICLGLTHSLSNISDEGLGFVFELAAAGNMIIEERDSSVELAATSDLAKASIAHTGVILVRSPEELRMLHRLRGWPRTLVNPFRPGRASN